MALSRYQVRTSSVDRDFTVTKSLELDEAPAMAVRIGDLHQAPPLGVTRGAFLHRAGGNCTRQRGVEILDAQITMQRRPMPRIAAWRFSGTNAAFRLREQIQRRFQAQQFE